MIYRLALILKIFGKWLKEFSARTNILETRQFQQRAKILIVVVIY